MFTLACQSHRDVLSHHQIGCVLALIDLHVSERQHADGCGHVWSGRGPFAQHALRG